MTPVPGHGVVRAPPVIGAKGLYFADETERGRFVVLLPVGPRMWRLQSGELVAATPKWDGKQWSLGVWQDAGEVRLEPSSAKDARFRLCAVNPAAGAPSPVCLRRWNDPFVQRVWDSLSKPAVFRRLEPRAPDPSSMDRSVGSIDVRDPLSVSVHLPNLRQDCSLGMFVPDPTNNGEHEPRTTAPPGPGELRGVPFLLLGDEHGPCRVVRDPTVPHRFRGGVGARVFVTGDATIVGILLIGYEAVELFVAKDRSPEEVRRLLGYLEDEVGRQAE